MHSLISSIENEEPDSEGRGQGQLLDFNYLISVLNHTPKPFTSPSNNITVNNVGNTCNKLNWTFC